MEDRVRTLVSGNSWGYIGSNWVCCWWWINMDLRMQYTSRKDNIFSLYSVVLRFYSKVCSRSGNIMGWTSRSVVCVCWIHKYVCSQCKRKNLGLQRRYSTLRNNGKGIMKIQGWSNRFKFSSMPRFLANASSIVTHIKMLHIISSKHRII